MEKKTLARILYHIYNTLLELHSSRYSHAQVATYQIQRRLVLRIFFTLFFLLMTSAQNKERILYWLDVLESGELPEDENDARKIASQASL